MLLIAGCRRGADALGAPMLGIDFKVESSGGAWYFLEANNMPCYQGYDRRAAGAISAALAEWFAGRSATRSGSRVATA